MASIRQRETARQNLKKAQKVRRAMTTRAARTPRASSMPAHTAVRKTVATVMRKTTRALVRTPERTGASTVHVIVPARVRTAAAPARTRASATRSRKRTPPRARASSTTSSRAATPTRPSRAKSTRTRSTRRTPSRTPARAAARRRAKPAAKRFGGFFHIEVRPMTGFTLFRTQDVGQRGGIERVAGRRPSGAWSTLKWLVSKDLAHVEGRKLVPDSADARRLLRTLGSAPVRISGDRFEAKDRSTARGKAKPTLAQKRARTRNLKKAQAARSRRAAA